MGSATSITRCVITGPTSAMSPSTMRHVTAAATSHMYGRTYADRRRMSRASYALPITSSSTMRETYRLHPGARRGVVHGLRLLTREG